MNQKTTHHSSLKWRVLSVVLAGLLLVLVTIAGIAHGTVRFVVTGDTRGHDNGVNTAILDEIVQATIDEVADFILITGDLVNGSSSQTELESQLTTWLTTMAPLYNAGIGVYPCRGNHDRGSKAAWDNVFSGTYALPGNGPGGEENITFSYTHGNVFIVGLDQYVSLSRVNQAWLDEQFALNTEPHIFVFGHEPAFKVNHSNCLDDYPSDRNTFWNSIAAEGGRIYFAGHDHFYDHARLDDGDGDTNDDLHQYIVGTGGARLYGDGLYDGDNGFWTPQRIHHETQYGYVLLEVDGPEVTVIWKARIAQGVYEAGDEFIYTTVNSEPPTADAGPNQTVDEGETVTLDGSGSTDPDDGIASYLWEQIDGAVVTLTGADTVQASFTAPDVGPSGTSLTFQLTVTDSGALQDTDTCTVNVTWENEPPTADAGPNQTVDEGETVTLDGSNSSDPDPEDGIATYQWTQIGGIPAKLSDPTAAKPTFVTPVVPLGGMILTFVIAVKDNGGLQDSDEVTVTVNDNGIGGFPDDVLTMTCSTGKEIGIKVESGGDLVSITAVDPATIPDSSDKPEKLPYGSFDLLIKTDALGGTVRVTFYLESPAGVNDTWSKHKTSTGKWEDCSAYASFNVVRDQVTLTLVDGGDGDDGPADGWIVDPSGLSSSAATTSSGGGGGGGGGCFIDTAADS